jgi:hypothetical protein
LSRYKARAAAISNKTGRNIINVFFLFIFSLFALPTPGL